MQMELYTLGLIGTLNHVLANFIMFLYTLLSFDVTQSSHFIYDTVFEKSHIKTVSRMYYNLPQPQTVNQTDRGAGAGWGCPAGTSSLLFWSISIPLQLPLQPREKGVLGYKVQHTFGCNARIQTKKLFIQQPLKPFICLNPDITTKCMFSPQTGTFLNHSPSIQNTLAH